MREPFFLELEEILEIHADQLMHYGGTSGLRDMGLLESALAMPKAQFGGQYLHGDLFEMAAAYAYHLVQNHPFVDGNKRVGAAAADIFLTLNGLDLKADPGAYEKLIFGITNGKLTKPDLADFFRRHCKH